MKAIHVAAGALLLILSVGAVRGNEAPPAAQGAESPAIKKQTLCPIMGSEINTNLFTDVQGKRVYFCCGGCPATFKKDAAKYIAKMEKEGITLEQTAATTPTKKPATTEATGQGGACASKCCK
jgi:YHS domain-containing protein